MIYKTVFLLFCVVCACVCDEASNEDRASVSIRGPTPVQLTAESFVRYSVFTTDCTGDSCFKDGVPGTCINIRNCKSAIEDLKRRKNPQICSFIGSDPVVCCMGAAPAPPPTTSTTTTKAPVPTTSKKPTQQPSVAPTADDDDEEYVNNDGSPTGCEPIDSKLTSKKIGQKAFDMCVEYQQKLIYPCKRGVALIGDFSRSFLCHHNADELIIGGEPAAENEFPHMVLLGFGPDIASVEWQCGGSLISDQWVLTAGHCTLRRRDDPVTFALMGALRRSDPLNPDKLRKVAQYLSAPDYNPPNRYNDIALVKLDKPVKLSQFLVPACVHIGDAVAEDRVLATGWGLTEYRGAVADQLQKVILNKFTLAECSAKFPKQRLMKQGFDNATQVCYGDKDKSRDTCQGDSGGPIQIKSKRLHCMYVVTGVTSFGKRCGNIGDPGIYTRVSNYLDWIEKTVWP